MKAFFRGMPTRFALRLTVSLSDLPRLWELAIHLQPCRKQLQQGIGWRLLPEAGSEDHFALGRPALMIAWGELGGLRERPSHSENCSRSLPMPTQFQSFFFVFCYFFVYTVMGGVYSVVWTDLFREELSAFFRNRVLPVCLQQGGFQPGRTGKPSGGGRKGRTVELKPM